MQFGPESFNFEFTIDKRTNKNHEARKAKVTFDTEDLIVFFAGIVAVRMTIGMLAHWVPVDKLTVSVASLSGVAAAVAKIVQARRYKPEKKKK